MRPLLLTGHRFGLCGDGDEWGWSIEDVVAVAVAEVALRSAAPDTGLLFRVFPPPHSSFSPVAPIRKKKKRMMSLARRGMREREGDG